METGNGSPCDTEIGAVRKRGEWWLDIRDEEALELFGRSGTVYVPDDTYLEWLEEKLIETYRL